MGSHSVCYCWEIMQCDKAKECPARMNTEKPCWEIACEQEDDYRNFFNICRDCIVHVLMADDCILSNQEIKNIVAAKMRCTLGRKKVEHYHESVNTGISPPG